MSSPRPSAAAATLVLPAEAPAGLLDVAAPVRPFDVQAHRGGLTMRPENTLAAFGTALCLGVSTIELDVHVTRDGHVVVTHDWRVDGARCADTVAAVPDDPQFPYVGKYVSALTLAQLRTLDCGSTTRAGFPGQLPDPGARMPLLGEVFDLIRRYRADEVRLNVELKVAAGAVAESAPREEFVRVVAEQVRAAGMLRRVTIQSFDWGALMLLRQVEPRLAVAALTDGVYLRAGGAGPSPWLGGLDLDDFGGDPVAAIHSFGAQAFTPVHGFPHHGTAGDAGYRPYVTRDMVRRAHRYGISVIPWTVNDAATMGKLLDDGVDGIITDRPELLRGVLAGRGHVLPRSYAAPRDAQAPGRGLAALVRTA